MSDFLLRAVDRTFPPESEDKLNQWMIRLVRWKGRKLLRNLKKADHSADVIVAFEYYVLGSLRFVRKLVDSERHKDVGQVLDSMTVPASKNVLSLLEITLRSEVRANRLDNKRARQLFTLAKHGNLPESVGSHISGTNSSSDSSSDESSDGANKMTIKKLDSKLKRIENQIAKVLESLNIN